MSSLRASLRISIRADGDDRIGAGHVARCLPLASALSGLGHRPVFVGTYGGLAAQLLARAGLESLPTDTEAPAGVSPTTCDAVIVDSYEIPADEICLLACQRHVATLAEAQRCPRSGVLIDYHLDRLGQTPTDRLLPGPAYAPIDPRFAAARRPRETVARALVTTGGGMVGDHLLESAIDGLRTVFPGAAVLSTSAGGTEHPGVEVLPRTSRLWEVLEGVDIAVSAAGLTAYELACAGVPAVLVAVAENQRRVARASATAGTALAVDASGDDLGPRLRGSLSALLDPVRRAALAARGTELLDGRGALRAAVGLVTCWKQ